MNIHLLLQRLGYAPGTGLSQIESENKLFAQTLVEYGTIDISSPIYSPINLSNKIYKLIKQEGTEINLYRLGHQLGERKEFPTLDELATALSPWLNELLRNKKIKLSAETVLTSGIRQMLSTEVGNAMTSVVKGYALATIYPFIDTVKTIVIKNRDFFEHYRPKNYEEYLLDVVKMHALNQLGLDDKTTITEWVSTNNLVETLQQSFKKLHMYDSKRVLEDLIKQIERKKKGGIFYRNETDELYTEGFQIAVKGQNPTISELLTAKYLPVQQSLALRFNHPFSWGFDPATKAQSIISAIAGGYAEAFYEIFLKDELKNLEDNPPPPPITATTSTHPAKLRWNGEKNDLYDILKQLKEQKALLNSHEELAQFLKNNVDIFEKTTLAEILKGMGAGGA